VLAFTVLTACTGCASGSATSRGAALVNDKCAQCHSLSRVYNARKTAAGWEATVSRMEGNGLRVSDAEKAAIIKYLAARYRQ
jgi:mono/diheme cytochrome c family protein